MGGVFVVPYSRLTDWRSGLAELRDAGFRLLALTPDPLAIPIQAVAQSGKIALLIGGEGRGLSGSWLASADQAVRIPMSRGVDSLNVASAAAIACYQFAAAH